jgi:hypothetical protein
MVNSNAAQQGNRVLLDTSTEARERSVLAKTVMTNPFLVKEGKERYERPLGPSKQLNPVYQLLQLFSIRCRGNNIFKPWSSF